MRSKTQRLIVTLIPDPDYDPPNYDDLKEECYWAVERAHLESYTPPEGAEGFIHGPDCECKNRPDGHYCDVWAIEQHIDSMGLYYVIDGLGLTREQHKSGQPVIIKGRVVWSHYNGPEGMDYDEEFEIE
jgi:hypothetical protein